MCSVEHYQQVFDLEWLLLHHQVEKSAQGVQVCFSDEWKVHLPSTGEWWFLAELAVAYSLEVLSKSAELWFLKQVTNAPHIRPLLNGVLLNISGLIRKRCVVLGRRRRNGQSKAIGGNGTIHTLSNRCLFTVGHSDTTPGSIRWLEWWILLQRFSLLRRSFELWRLQGQGLLLCSNLYLEPLWSISHELFVDKSCVFWSKIAAL